MTNAQLIAAAEAAEAATARLRDTLLAMDLATARYSHGLARCRRLAGDARALLQEATDATA